MTVSYAYDCVWLCVGISKRKILLKREECENPEIKRAKR